MHHRSIVVLVAGLLGGWSPLAAQAAPAASEPDSAPTPPAFAADIVVTAELDPEQADRVSATVDVIDAAEIERRQAGLALDLLRTVPGLAVTQTGSPGKVASLFLRGGSGAQTLVLLDGVVLNDPALAAFDASTTSTEGLDRIEIVRGPYSALFGSGAIGGVVQLVTREPAGRQLDLRLEGGSNDYGRASLIAAAPVGPLALDLSGHWRQGEGRRDNDDFDSDAGQLRAQLDPVGSWRFGLLARVGRIETGIPDDGFGTLTPRRRQDGTAELLALPVHWNGRRDRLELRLARTDAELEVTDPDDPFGASDAATRREQARAIHTHDFAGDWKLSVGGEWQREEATTATGFGPGLTDAAQEADAFFAQASWGRGRWRLDGGVRRDDHSSFGDATSFKAGALVDLAAGIRLRANYGESFRAPSLGDLYYPFFGNPDLEAERGASAELGLEGGGGRGGWRVTAFHNDVDDLIQFDSVRFVPLNIGRARMRGVETGVLARGAAWSARADLTWLDAEDRTTGEPLLRRPEWSGSLQLGWQRSGFDGGAVVRYHGERFDVGQVRLPGYTVVDLTASWRAHAHFAPFARIENLLDRDYEEAIGYPALERSWVIGVALRGGR